MPIFKKKNENFFKKWTPEMAYVLGFFIADGSMRKNKRGAHFIEFHITDREILEKIRKAMDSNHKISIRKRNKMWKPTYRLQIGSKIIYNDLLKLGVLPRKARRIKLPKIPDKYFPHFLRGYFDGDGNVTITTYKRKDRNITSTILLCGFVAQSKPFLKELLRRLKLKNIVRGGTFYYHDGWRLVFSVNDCERTYNFIYQKVDLEKGLFLKRKKKIFEKYFRKKWGRRGAWSPRFPVTEQTVGSNPIAPAKFPLDF